MIKIAWAPIYVHPLPKNHRFPMEKYELLPMQLLHEDSSNEQHFFSPEPNTASQLLVIHQKEYWQKLEGLQLSRKEELQSGFPQSKALIERELVICGGSLQASLFNLENGIAFNIAGGTHHAYANRAEGFCLLNDIAISAQYLLDKKYVTKVLVIDLDVHQGNGTAKIFKNENRVFTFSMHGAHNYPLKKEKSDLDIPLADKTKDKAYLSKVREVIPNLLRIVKPDYIFYQSGVDIL